MGKTKEADTAIKTMHPVVTAVKSYLRVCSSGGMPREQINGITSAVENAAKLGYFAKLVEFDDSEPHYYGINFCPNCGQRAPDKLHDVDGYTYCASCDP